MDQSKWTNELAVVRECEPSLSLPVPPCRCDGCWIASDRRRHRDSERPLFRPLPIPTNTPHLASNRYNLYLRTLTNSPLPAVSIITHHNRLCSHLHSPIQGRHPPLGTSKLGIPPIRAGQGQNNFSPRPPILHPADQPRPTLFLRID